MSLQTTFSKEEIQAVYEAVRDRRIDPEGKFDNGGRWYPSDEEDCGVSRVIRSPSRSWPYSYLTACRTRKHVQAVAETQPELFRRKLAKIGR